ncbi:MAG: SO_0444 family Cu/Zn efflux transporter [Prevotellaceae bacterium]|nr:SO_0444 family Cu/Zn efflux transporter [Prevotellaceae bacterium]
MMSPYLLLGFLLAGLMHAFIPSRYYTRFLSRKNMRSVVSAALFGIPLPLCSCGVIPTAMSLRREGASKGATTAFLIATPQTGIDSIIATFALMGLPFAIVRPVAALLTSLFGGALANVTDRSAEVQPPAQEGCCSQSTPCERLSLPRRLGEALRYAYLTMMQDIGKWLVVGLVVAGLITVLVPETAFTVFRENTFASMLLVLVIAMPMYVCATGSIPIAVVLMLKGLTPGAALVLLMAGPACNFASMLVVRKVMGLRSLVTYLVSIILGAIVFGCLIDWLQFHGVVDFMAKLTQQAMHHSRATITFYWCCTAVLLLLLFNALVISKINKSNKSITSTSMNTSVYRIEGMSCNHCRMTAEKALLSVPGVENASVDLATGQAQVTGAASREALAKAIEEVGFTLVEG